jgi:hypothetical protein
MYENLFTFYKSFQTHYLIYILDKWQSSYYYFHFTEEAERPTLITTKTWLE